MQVLTKPTNSAIKPGKKRETKRYTVFTNNDEDLSDKYRDLGNNK